MPIFVYRCGCGEEFEELQEKSDNFIRCINCGGLAKKMITAANNFIFTEKKKEIYKMQTGIEINDRIEERKYLEKYGGIFVSKKEWEEIKAKQESKYDLNINKKALKEKMAEEMKRVVENKDERKRIIEINKRNAELTNKLLKDELENAKI